MMPTDIHATVAFIHGDVADGPQATELILAGGTVIDPATGLHSVADVTVAGDRILSVGENSIRDNARVVDCTGKYVVPGLIDAHSHVFPYVSRVGAPPDEAHLRRGVVAVADAGSVGASTFAAFERFVVEPAEVRIVAFLNVSVLGLIDFRFGELLNPDTLCIEDALEVAVRRPDIVRGFKIRLSRDVVGERCLPLLVKAAELAEQADLPLMVHIGETAEPLPAILDVLRPGDIVSHCYTGKEHGIMDARGMVDDAVIAARRRGIVFDSAHGKSNFSFAVARPAIASGFLPDIISSDTSARNWRGPVFDLVTTMSKFLALGVCLEDIVARTTEAPARLLGLDAEGYGMLRPGGPAHITVLAIEDQESVLSDATSGTVLVRRLEPALTLVNGLAVTLLPWRGAA